MSLFGKKNKKNEIDDIDDQIPTEQILESLASNKVAINPNYFKRQVKSIIEKYLICFYSGYENNFPYEAMTDSFLKSNIELLKREKNNRIQRVLYSLVVNNVKPISVDDTLIYLLSSIEFEVTFTVKFSIIHSTFIQADEKELKVNYLFVNGANYRNKLSWLLDREISRKELKSEPFDLNSIQQRPIIPMQAPFLPNQQAPQQNQPNNQYRQQIQQPLNYQQPNQYIVPQGQYIPNQPIGYQQQQYQTNQFQRNIQQSLYQQQGVNQQAAQMQYNVGMAQNFPQNQFINQHNSPNLSTNNKDFYETQESVVTHDIAIKINELEFVKQENENEHVNASEIIVEENDIKTRKNVTHPVRKKKRDYSQLNIQNNEQNNEQDSEQDSEQVNESFPKESIETQDKKDLDKITENKKNKNLRKNIRPKDEDLITEDIL